MTVDVTQYIRPNTSELLQQRLPDRKPEDLEIQLREVLKFLYVISSSDKSFIPLNREADDVWHELILQTKSYFDLCNELPGRRYIHHESVGLGDYADNVGTTTTVQQFLWWIPRYVESFGPFTPEVAEYWTIIEFLKAEIGLTLEQINEIGLREATVGA